MSAGLSQDLIKVKLSQNTYTKIETRQLAWAWIRTRLESARRLKIRLQFKDLILVRSEQNQSQSGHFGLDCNEKTWLLLRSY